MPLEEAKILDYFPDKDLTFELGSDLDAYGFSIDDSVELIFKKYFFIHDHLPFDIR